MNHPLKQAVGDHFGQQKLTVRRLQQLETMMADGAPKQATARSSQTRRHALQWSIAIAASMLVALAAVLQSGWLDREPMTQRIALEVAQNHIRLKPMDVSTESMNGIRNYFTDLDFVPVESALLPTATLKLLGGRYCSIQSVPAAQLRMVPSSGGDAVQTFYQTEYREDVFGPLPAVEDGDVPVRISVKGIDIDIWVEKGLLLALAREPGGLPRLPQEDRALTQP
jgi:hypothetical protein